MEFPNPEKPVMARKYNSADSCKGLKMLSEFIWSTYIFGVTHVISSQAIQMEKNSLNNRFFPFDAIETDAVLSIDDDVYVSHENLLFAFRYICYADKHR